ncbi:MAG: hypothetical protein ABSA44_11520 [Bacteroidota bacterium]|jgi:hypothetical protein
MEQKGKNQFASDEVPFYKSVEGLIKGTIKFCAWLLFLHLISFVVRGYDPSLVYAKPFGIRFIFTILLWLFSPDLYERICSRPLTRNELIKIALDIILLFGLTIFTLWRFLELYIF